MALDMEVRAQFKLRERKKYWSGLGQKNFNYGPSLRNVASSEKIRGSYHKLKYKKILIKYKKKCSEYEGGQALTQAVWRGYGVSTRAEI